MTDWQDIATAPREESKCVLVCWEGCPKSVCILIWKTNLRIVSARKSGVPTDGMVDSYFGCPQEADDYDLAKPENSPTHWMPLPEPPPREEGR